MLCVLEVRDFFLSWTGAEAYFPKSHEGKNLGGPSGEWTMRLGQCEAKWPNLASEDGGKGGGFTGSRDLQPCPYTPPGRW